MHQRIIAIAILAMIVAGGAGSGAWAGEQAADRARCESKTCDTVRAAAAVDGRTLLLAGIAALQALVAGRDIELLRLGVKTDRYGRHLALVWVAAGAPVDTPVFASTAADAGAKSLQLALLGAGHARVAALVGDIACAREMLAVERAARAGGLGLWREPYYLVSKAGNVEQILALRGSFAVVKGEVLLVRDCGAQFYLNFGRRSAHDFTVTALKRNARRFTAAGLPISNLVGRNVRVHGTIEERGGPWIEAAHPEPIKIAERD
jgi:micrococcal nuclease